MPPTLLIESLQDLRRRVKLFGVLYGVGIVIACAVALVLAAVLIDWSLALPTAPRLIVNFAGLGAFFYAFYRWILRPAMRRLSLSDLAGRLEERYPEFNDSLRSTVDFLGKEVPGSYAMQERTMASATERAKRVDIAHAVELKPVWYSMGSGVGAVVLMVALVVVASREFPDFLRIATNHLLGGRQPWPKEVEMDLLSDVPARVAVGQRVDLKIHITKGTVHQAIVRYRYDNGPWQQEVMDAEAGGNFTAAVDARLEGQRDNGRLQIKVEAGDAETDLRPVSVVPRLDIKGIEARVTPPAYAGLPAVPVNIAERPVVTAIGSDIELRLSFNKALDVGKGIRIEPADRAHAMPAANWTFPSEGSAVARFTTFDPRTFRPNDPFKFTVRATDIDGFENIGSQEYAIIVHEDGLPTVQIEEPRHSEDRTPDATIPMKVVAEDDYGIDLAQLVINRTSGRVGAAPTTEPSAAAPTTAPAAASGRGVDHWVIDLHRRDFSADAAGPGINALNASWTQADSSTERKRFRLEYPWDLSKLEGGNLKPGDVLEFFVQVRDNYNINGTLHPMVQSAKLKINIISHDQWDAHVETALAAMKQEIGQIKKSQDVNHQETQTQAKETGDKQKVDDAQKATIGRLATQQANAAAQVKQIAQKMDELIQKMNENKSPEKGMKETAKDVGKQLEQTSEGAMKQATSDLTEAKDAPADPKASAPQRKQDAQKAAESLDKAAGKQQQASDELQKAMDKLNDFGGLAPAIQKIKDLADRQKKLDTDYKKDLKTALGKQPDALTPNEKQALKDLKEKQDALAKDTEKALDNMEQKAEKMAKSDPAASKAMKDAAQTGKQQGIPPKQQQASESMQQNQQANAQQQQKQVELGLEMVLQKLTEAERRKLEELRSELAELQKLIDEIAARQATHNLDNLALQDPSGKKLSDLSQDDREALFSLAGRDAADANAPKADLGVMTPSQEQTERNCRDLAKRTEALPDPVPSSKLTAAASKMEQAIVFLRKAQLAEAYQPPQVEALKALLEARAAIAEAKKKADDAAKQQNEETIKQAYVKLLEQQKKLDEETRNLDSSPRDADGNIGREPASRLARLPGAQGELGDAANKLGEKLDSLGSIVYKWANKDIVDSMVEVKEDLAKPVTGIPTQAEQKRIEEQLQAMIDNLAQPKKKNDAFAQKQNKSSGGGGSGKKPPPRMPTDVELRLLKDLQTAINKSTNRIDEQPEKDAHKLLSLGNRQGELRGVLDQLLQKSSQGQVKLGKEPENKDQLPEEAAKDAVADNDLVKNLLDDAVDEDQATKSFKLTGDRMARSRQRLALNNDPGKITQEIQKRIVLDIDDMIKLAQKQQQQQQQQASGKGKPGEKPGEAKPGEGEGQQQVAQGKKPGQPAKGNQKGGMTPAGDSALPPGGDPTTDLSRDIKETREEWGKNAGRDRQAVMEGAGEKSISKYDQYIRDYYRELAKKASER